MPRIRAASVAEHRRMRRTALLDAARTLLAEGGVTALTFPALAERTGLARSSVYEYFGSRAAVVEELCAVDFPRWAAEVEAAMAAPRTPTARIEAYVRQQLALAADRRHRAVVAVSAGELSETARERIRAAHAELLELVVGVLRELGHEEPRVTALLLQGVVDAAVRGADGLADGPADAVVDAAVRLALHGVAGPGAAAVAGDGNAFDREQPGGTTA